MIEVHNPVYMVPGDRYTHHQVNGDEHQVTFIACISDAGYGRMRVMGYEDVAGRTVLMLVHPSGLVAGDKAGWVNFNEG